MEEQKKKEEKERQWRVSTIGPLPFVSISPSVFFTEIFHGICTNVIIGVCNLWSYMDLLIPFTTSLRVMLLLTVNCMSQSSRKSKEKLIVKKMKTSHLAVSLQKKVVVMRRR